jgi:hypothetical protein
MKISDVRIINQSSALRYGCDNCTQQGNPCVGRNRLCRLDVTMVEHLIEPERIDGLNAVLSGLGMRIAVHKMGFQVVRE